MNIDLDEHVRQGTKTTIRDAICDWAKTCPDAPAFVAEGKAPLTYEALAHMVNDLRESLNISGFGCGDRLAIIHRAGTAMATTLLGVMNAATAIPLNSDSPKSDIRTQLLARGADGVIVEECDDTPARDIAASLGLPVFEVAPVDENVAGLVRLRSSDENNGRRSSPAQAEDVAYVLSTSGTTSRGKVAPFRHRHLMARAITQAGLFALTQNDRSLNLQPLHFNSGITNIACTLYSGGSVVVMPKFNVEDFYRLFDSLRPTWFAGSFTYQHHIYSAGSDQIDIIRQSSLRFIRTMSGHLDPKIGAGLERIFGVPLIESYGSTEAGRITGNPQPPGKRKLGTAGPIVGCEAFIADDQGNRLENGERGEIVVKGAQVIDGYENDPVANAAAFADGWYRTGDEGFFDEDGYLHLTGRIEEMINRGGEKISPQEVDSALMAHPEIADAAAFAIPHRTLGEIVGAAIVPTLGKKLTKQALTRFLFDRLTPFKVPRAFFFVDEIPKGATGKILRKQLTDRFKISR